MRGSGVLVGMGIIIPMKLVTGVWSVAEVVLRRGV